MDDNESEALRQLLYACQPSRLKSKKSTWLERCRQHGGTEEQAGALRKACLLVGTQLGREPGDFGVRSLMAELLSDLHSRHSFTNSGAIAEQLSSVEIEEDAFLSALESKLFDSGRKNETLVNRFDAMLAQVKERETPKPAVVETPKEISTPKPFSTDAFTTAKKMIDPMQLKAAAQRKNLGGKRWANVKDESADDLNEVKTEFGYYNLTKAPVLKNQPSGNQLKRTLSDIAASNPPQQQPTATKDEPPVDERLQGIEPRLIEMIRNEIMTRVDSITWERIAGLEHAKKTIFEIVIWPMLRPDLFNGLRGPPKGLLLFGPPGTGKTMIGKCIASQAKATFFSISASSLTSKWVGESEKMVRALFAVARCHQPAVIFIDEIDSMLCQRTDGEVEATRRLKTEFLVQFDGAATSSEDRILVIGATNRPQELDEAARRRLVKRLYIPLPDNNARRQIILSLLSNQKHALSDDDMNAIVKSTDGYSGADMDSLCREAALGPIRAISDIMAVSAAEVRAIGKQDFDYALTQVRASVSGQDLEGYLDWNTKFGSLSAQ